MSSLHIQELKQKSSVPFQYEIYIDFILFVHQKSVNLLVNINEFLLISRRGITVSFLIFFSCSSVLVRQKS